MPCGDDWRCHHAPSTRRREGGSKLESVERETDPGSLECPCAPPTTARLMSIRQLVVRMVAGNTTSRGPKSVNHL